jgi:thioredoxin-like negative regulator of GroEL
MKLLKFYTPSCNPCKTQSLILNQADLTGVELHEIDCEIDPVTASKFKVNSVPALVFIKNEKEIARFVGLTPPEDIEEVIREHV